MKAQLLLDHKTVVSSRAILQLKIWKVPDPVPPRTHGFKYRLVYVRNGERIVGFEDFIAEVNKRRR